MKLKTNSKYSSSKTVKQDMKRKLDSKNAEKASNTAWEMSAIDALKVNYVNQL